MGNIHSLHKELPKNMVCVYSTLHELHPKTQEMRICYGEKEYRVESCLRGFRIKDKTFSTAKEVIEYIKNETISTNC